MCQMLGTMEYNDDHGINMELTFIEIKLQYES